MSKQLNKLLQALIGMDWIYPSISTKFNEYAPPTKVRYKRTGTRVSIMGTIKPASAITIDSSNPVEIFTLPVGFRPDVTLVTLQQGSGMAIWCAKVEVSGKVYAERYRDETSTQYPVVPTTAWMPMLIEFDTSEKFPGGGCNRVIAALKRLRRRCAV